MVITVLRQFSQLRAAGCLTQTAASRANASRSTSEGKNEAILMRSFLDLLWKDVEENPSRLVPYTEEMDAELDELLAGVEAD